MTFNELLHFCNGHQRPSANCYIFTKEKKFVLHYPVFPGQLLYLQTRIRTYA